MTAVGQFIIAEGAVTTAAILAGIGYLYRQGKTKDAKLWQTIGKLKRRTKRNRKNIIQLRIDVGHLMRDVPQLKENAAIMSTELEKHLDGHIRRNDPPTPVG